jgi:hypothetical protein
MPTITITGYLNGISYYLENGKPRQRIPNPPTKEQIYNDPRFATVRANTDTALTIWLGISFGKIKITQFELFQTARAMECIAIL